MVVVLVVAVDVVVEMICFVAVAVAVDFVKSKDEQEKEEMPVNLKRIKLDSSGYCSVPLLEMEIVYEYFRYSKLAFHQY